MEKHVVTHTFFPPEILPLTRLLKVYGRVRQAIDDLVLYCAKGVIFMPGNEDINA